MPERPPATHPALQFSTTSEGAEVAAVLTAMSQPFVVVDVETTGLDAETDELLEIGAVLADPSGAVTQEFSVLVRPSREVPFAITELAGITQAMVDAEGRPLSVALRQFLGRIGDRPLLCHNAPFDASFLQAAARAAKLHFRNPVHDTMPLVRKAWPELGSYRLSALVARACGRRPTHRALSDARATLDVLLAARKALGR